MKCEGFTPLKRITLGNRLALTDMEIRWDSDGEEDTILGILPVMRNSLHDVTTSAAYDFSISVKMICDDHPRLRRLLRPVADKLNRWALGQ